MRASLPSYIVVFLETREGKEPVADYVPFRGEEGNAQLKAIKYYNELINLESMYSVSLCKVVMSTDYF